MEQEIMSLADLPALGTGSTVLVALIAIAFGLLNCFFGYRIFRVLLAIYGLVLGAFVGLAVAGTVAGGQALWLIVGAIAGAIVGAALMVLLYFVGVFVVGALAGALLANTIGAVVGIDMPTLVVIVVAVMVVIVALIAQRVVIILVTAFSGAWGAVSGAVLLLAGHSLPGLSILARPAAWQGVDLPMLASLLVLLALGIAGAVVQFRTTGEQPAPPSSHPAGGPHDR
jgi:hypothetical protein